MTNQALTLLLPCHSLDDFPVHVTGKEADNLLACWTAGWHPALIAAANHAPSWMHIDDPPTEIAGNIILVPTICHDSLPTGLADRAKEEGAALILSTEGLMPTLDAVLESATQGDGGMDEAIVNDFLALGYCYLQVELLTRHLRYASNLDETHFQNQVLAAAHAAAASDQALMEEKLSACFDILAEERDHFYPVDAYLLDLTLLAKTTLGKSLQDTLNAPTPLNLLASGEVIQTMAEKHPDSLHAVKEGLASNKIGLVGGEKTERRLPLLCRAAIAANIEEGISLYEEHLGRRPEIYGRRRFGLTPMLPSVLHPLHFKGAIHATLDDGKFPEGGQIKIDWEGPEGTVMDAIANVPFDASLPETYLNLSTKIGYMMDADHFATVCLAHWPGQASIWHSLLMRIATRSLALGKFMTIESYFAEAESSMHVDRFPLSDYHSPYLKEASERGKSDPVSSVQRYWQRRTTAQYIDNLNAMRVLISGKPASQEAWVAAVDQQGEEDPSDGSEIIDEQMQADLTTASAELAKLIPRSNQPSREGYLALNLCSFARRISLDAPKIKSPPPITKPIYAAKMVKDACSLAVDIPSCGFTWIDEGKGSAPAKRPPRNLIEEESIRNEYFELQIDPITGAMRSMRDYKSRGNRFSQQIAFREKSPQPEKGHLLSDADVELAYSIMAADRVETTQNSPLIGEMTVTGRLLNREGKLLANYRQIFCVRRGSRVLDLTIELDPQKEVTGDPWDSYYCCRLAWADEASDIRTNLGFSRSGTTARRLEAPLLIDIESTDKRTSILSGGLPFHRRVGYRMLDTLLIPRGESARRFRIGIGIDLPYPMLSAIDFLTPPSVVQEHAAPPEAGATCWLLHLDAKNVIMTSLAPWIEEGEVVGFRAQLQETMGRSATVHVESFRPLQSASRINLLGDTLDECAIEKGRAKIKIEGHGWETIAARFS